jgi:hypothetical protein
MKRQERVGRVAVFAAFLLAPAAMATLSSMQPSAPGVTQATQLLAISMAAAVALFVPGVGATLLLTATNRCRAPQPALACGLIVGVSGLAWWAVFWLWLASSEAGVVASAAVFLLGAGACALAPKGAWRAARSSLAIMAITVAAFLVPAGMVFAGGGSSQPISTVARATLLTADNAYPAEWVRRVADDGDLRALTFGDYSLADRPPVQAAMSLPFEVVGADRELTSQVVGSLLQGLALVGSVLLLRIVGLKGVRLQVSTLLVTLTLFVSLNTLFVWPKLFPAGVVLIAAAVLIEASQRPKPGENDAVQPGWAPRWHFLAPNELVWVVSVGLVGMSIVTHPIGILSLPLFVVIWIRHRPTVPTRVTVCCCLAAFAAFAAVWAGYLITVDAGTSALARWHLAGTSHLTDARPVTTAIVDELRQLGPTGWLQQRWANVNTFVGWDNLAGSLSGTFFTGGSIHRWATNLMFFAPLWSGGLLIFILPLLAAWRRLPRPAVSLLLGSLSTIALWLTVQFGPPLAHAFTQHSPYAALLALALTTATAAVSLLPRWSWWALLVAQAAVWGQLLWYASRNVYCHTACSNPMTRIEVTTVLPPVAFLSIIGVAMLVALVWTSELDVGADTAKRHDRRQPGSTSGVAPHSELG